MLIGFLNFTLALGQTYSTVTTDEEIYGFLNWMTINEEKYREEPKLKRKRVYYKILSWDTANFISKDTSLIIEHPYFTLDDQYLYQRLGGTDTIFEQHDRNFQFEQFTAIRDSVWHRRFSRSKLLKSKKQKKTNRYYYSIPLFSADKKYVIIRRIYYCGNLCAHGGYFVYRRLDKNNWEFLTSINTWVS